MNNFKEGQRESGQLITGAILLLASAATSSGEIASHQQPLIGSLLLGLGGFLISRASGARIPAFALAVAAGVNGAVELHDHASLVPALILGVAGVASIGIPSRRRVE